jgi:transcriptional regulator with XRE-family HTH domain
MSILGERIRQTRERRGLKQDEVAKALGKTHSAVSYYEAGKRNPTPAELADIARLLQVSTDYLIGLTDDPRTANQRIEDAIADDPKMSGFWQAYHDSAEVRLMLRSISDLTPSTARKIVSVMMAFIEAEKQQDK